MTAVNNRISSWLIETLGLDTGRTDSLLSTVGPTPGPQASESPVSPGATAWEPPLARLEGGGHPPSDAFTSRTPTESAPARPGELSLSATEGLFRWGPGGLTPITQGTPTLISPELGRALAQFGSDSIATKMGGHLQSIEETGVGRYYGDHSSFKKMTFQEQQDWLLANTKPGALAPYPRESSCIGWVMENVGAAYRSAGMGARWSEIERHVYSHGTRGIELARELQKDGWQAIYWNPDARNPNDNNAEHSFSALQVARGRGYYGLTVTDSVLNYRPTLNKGTVQDLSGIAKLEQAPFFFGLAKGGVHTFVGRFGNVNEFHWTAMPNTPSAIDEKPLKDWGWNSGVLMVPPGTWPAAS